VITMLFNQRLNEPHLSSGQEKSSPTLIQAPLFTQFERNKDVVCIETFIPTP